MITYVLSSDPCLTPTFLTLPDAARSRKRKTEENKRWH